VILDWPELITITLGAGVAGYYLHAGISRTSVRTEHDVQAAVRRASENSPLIMRHEVHQEIERLETRLAELRKMEKKFSDEARQS
jgi:hypothetical protein